VFCHIYCVLWLFCVRGHISRRRWHWSAWNFAWWYILVPHVFSLFGDPQNPKFWPSNKANFSTMVSRSSITCQLQLKISLMWALLKCIVWDGSHPGESPVRKNMYIFARTGDRYLAAIGLKICMMLQLSRMWVSSLFVAISLRVSKWGQIDFF